MTSNKVFENCVKMCLDRGLAIEKQVPERLILIAKEPSDEFHQVFFCFRDTKIGVSDIKKILEEIACPHIIIVCETVTSSAKKEIEKEKIPSKLEIFTNQEMAFDIFEHYLLKNQKPFSVKDPKDIERVKLRYKSLDVLPTMLHTDKVARRLGLQPGDLILVPGVDNLTSQFMVCRLAPGN